MSESVKELRRALQAKDREIAAFISKAWGLGDYPAGLEEKQRRRVEEEVRLGQVVGAHTSPSHLGGCGADQAGLAKRGVAIPGHGDYVRVRRS